MRTEVSTSTSMNVPSVLAVVVVKDGAAWLRRSLASLARQTHPRLGVLAVDNGSVDRSPDILAGVLGRRRVLRLDRNRGFPAAVRRALEVPAAKEADYVLLLHDDVLLAPEAVSRLVQAAERVQGAGVVAPKVLDWEDPQVLREVGHTADRFGYPHSPLEEGEIDHGQYDAPREVLFASSAAMLVSRAAWQRAGPPDERFGAADADLDFCWRVRLSGFRVLVSPDAVAFHRSAGWGGERPGAPPYRPRYHVERAALASLLVNYRVVTLVWVLPLYAVLGLGRLAVYVLSRRFEGAAEVLAAWGWNLVHVPGTIRRRVRSQALRRVPDREIARFMSPTGARLGRWALQASTLLVARRTGAVEEGEELEAPPLGHRAASLVAAHPVAVALLAAAVVTVVGFRGVLFVPRIEGGALPLFPDGPGVFFRELASPWRSTGFGGPEMASPALALLGAGSAITLGSPQLLARLLVALGPLAGGICCYQALRSLRTPRGPAVIAASCYGFSALTLWAASEGRIAVVVLLVALPFLAARLFAAFAPGGPRRPLRWAVGSGMILGAAVAFFPGTRLGLVAVAAPFLLIPERGGSRLRGGGLTVLAAAVAAALVFPLALHLAGIGAGAGVEIPARPHYASLLRLSPGDAPGAGVSALFLPLAGLLGFVLAEGERRRGAWRAFITAAAAIPLAWLAAAGHLPSALANPVAYLAAAAVSLAFLVGLGGATLSADVRGAALGARHALAASLTAVVGVGLGAQAIEAALGGWAVGQERVAPAWPVVAASEPDVPFRVLWLGVPDGTRFPAPGGDAEGRVVAGGTEVAYAVTGRAGRSALAIGLPPAEEPHERLEAALASILSGRVRHGGALLSPFGVGFVVAGAHSLPGEAAARLADQVDIDLLQRAGGLVVYRNARALPVGSVVPGRTAVDAARAGAPLSPLAIDPGATAPLSNRRPDVWVGSATGGEPSLVAIAHGHDARWRLEGRPPFPAFGWALGFEARPGTVEVTYRGGPRRALELGALVVLWAAALWTVRRSSRQEPAPARRPLTVEEKPLTSAGRAP